MWTPSYFSLIRRLFYPFEQVFVIHWCFSLCCNGFSIGVAAAAQCWDAGNASENTRSSRLYCTTLPGCHSSISHIQHLITKFPALRLFSAHNIGKWHSAAPKDTTWRRNNRMMKCMLCRREKSSLSVQTSSVLDTQISYFDFFAKMQIYMHTI